MRKLFILFCCILLSYSSFSQLVINEYSCANMGTITDNFGKTPDWIEIYNASAISVNLSTYYLSDKTTNPLKWQLPNINLNAGQRILFYASNRNITASAPYHTNFKLT
ncbi:MAG: lamin tail domain-containing protein, partial [Candidatus Kuenenia stuttgartiensis]|nr:lamin tail domain-containing protein [Candidatus Kuenenia stuttgartiensis]